MSTDWQRQKLYDVEGRFRYRLDKGHYLNTHVGLDEGRIRAIVEDVFEAVEERYGYRTELKNIRASRGSQIIATATRVTGELAFNPRFATPLVVIHEACHLATDDHVPGHGIEFAENMLIAMKALFSSHEERLLRHLFDMEGVHYSYEQRAAYTRKRARWAVGSDGHPVTTIVRRTSELQGRQPRFLYKKGYREPDGILLAKAGVADGKDGKPEAVDLLVPYDTIAYIERW